MEALPAPEPPEEEDGRPTDIIWWLSLLLLLSLLSLYYDYHYYYSYHYIYIYNVYIHVNLLFWIYPLYDPEIINILFIIHIIYMYIYIYIYYQYSTIFIYTSTNKLVCLRWQLPVALVWAWLGLDQTKAIYPVAILDQGRRLTSPLVKALIIKIHQRGVQWKQGVVVYNILWAVLLDKITPIHCAPLRLHPPLTNTHDYYDYYYYCYF